MSADEADERATLEYLVDRQRAEISRLLDDLSETEARERLVPSLTTVLGLVKHAIFVEQVWFHVRLAERTRAELGVGETVDESFVLDDADTISTVREAYLATCERSREIAARYDLDVSRPWHNGPVSLRYIYAHMIAELARHAGHGDILVEQLKARREADAESTL